MMASKGGQTSLEGDILQNVKSAQAAAKNQMPSSTLVLCGIMWIMAGASRDRMAVPKQ